MISVNDPWPHPQRVSIRDFILMHLSCRTACEPSVFSCFVITNKSAEPNLL